MRSLGTRRAALATGVATLAAIALAGCSAGQVAETAIKNPSVYGVNADSSDSSVFVRNLAVAYSGSAGYAAGADAPLQVGLFNQTKQPITVLISSQPATAVSEQKSVLAARSVTLAGGTATASTAPSAAPEPSSSSPATTSSAPPAGPARIVLEPLGSATFLPDDTQKLVAAGLSGKLVPGASLNLVFQFSNGADPLVLQAPVAVSLTPASRAPGLESEHEEE